MNKEKLPAWLEWARQIQQLCQTGLAFSESDYDTERYKQLTKIAAEIVSSYSGLNDTALYENLLAHPGYATPKVDIRAAVIENNKLLLVQEKMDNKWAMPGGWADVCEAPSEAIIRETKEESGLDVIPKKIIGIYDANRGGRPLEFFHAFKLVFLCDKVGGVPTVSDETLDVKYFEFDALPSLSKARTNQNHIDDIIKNLKDSTIPTVFE